VSDAVPPTAEAAADVKVRPNADRLITIAFVLVTFIVYFVSSRGEGAVFNYFVRLADAFVHGRLDVIDQPVHLAELVPWQGKWYVIFPPVPAVLLMPLVAIFGASFSQPLYSVLVGAINVGLAYRVFVRLFGESREMSLTDAAPASLSGNSVAVWMTLLYAFGTIQWYHAEVGSGWYVAHIVALMFMWLFLLEATGRRRLFLCGLLIGAAHLSRLPTIFAVAFLPLFLRDTFFDGWRPRIKPFVLFGSGVVPALVVNALYNYARFGTFKDVQFIQTELLGMTNDPTVIHGVMSVRYIPMHLKEIMMARPLRTPKFPYIMPSEFALAVWFTTPAFVLMLRSQRRYSLWLPSIAAAVAIAIPSLMHGGNGFTQFGYRHTLDYMPFLLLLVGLGMRGRVGIISRVLIVASIVVNLWGVVMISTLRQSGF
jgi:hypothetical protein